MKLNQFSIRLNPCLGQYEEYPLASNETGNVLPGAIVALKPNRVDWKVFNGVTGTAQTTGAFQSEVDPPTVDGKILVSASGTPGSEDYVPAHYEISRPCVSSQATDISAVELLVVTENSYEHGSINHKYRPNEIVHLRRAVSSDRYLLRAVQGSYHEGDAIYLTQTTNGIYVTNTADTDARQIGVAAESYVVYGADNGNVTPRFYYDAVDDSTPIRPSSRWLNGAVFNLLSVRIL